MAPVTIRTDVHWQDAVDVVALVRVWGVPIPIFYCAKCGKDIVIKKTKKGRRYYGCMGNT